MLKQFKNFFMVLFVLVLSASVLYINYERPRILVLHSYSLDYVWTKEVNVGLERIFQDHSWVDIRYHYMSAKKFKDQDELRRSAIAARNAVDNIRPNVLIAIDDDAQSLVAKYYVDDPHIRIVFAGINGGIEPYGYDHANNVTGILERKPAAAIKEMVAFMGSLNSLLHPQSAASACSGSLQTKGKTDSPQFEQSMLAVKTQVESAVETVNSNSQDTAKKTELSKRASKSLSKKLNSKVAVAQIAQPTVPAISPVVPIQSSLSAAPAVDALATVEAIREGAEVSWVSDQARSNCRQQQAPFRALFLGDQSHSVVLDAAHLSSYQDWNPVDYRGEMFVKTYREWQDFVLKADRYTDYLLVGGYRTLHSTEDKGFVDAGSVMEWTEANSPVPVLGMNAFNTADGAMLSVGVSPFEQGEIAAKYAFRILRDHEPIGNIPIMTSQQYVISMRKSALVRRNIQLPSVFEAFSRATNNYFE